METLASPVVDYNTKETEVLAHKAFETITNILRDVVVRIDSNQCKDSLDVFQPYLDKDHFNELRVQYDNVIKQRELDQQEEQEEEEEEEQEDIDDNEDYLLSIKNTAYAAPTNTKLIQMKPAKAIKKPTSFWGLKGSLNSSVTAASTNSNSSSAINSSSTNGEERQSRKKRSSTTPGGLPLNWGLLVGMLSNVSLDQIKSMANLLIMIISRTPVKVLLTKITSARLVVTSVYDLLYAVYRRDVKDIGISILYVLIAYNSFQSRSGQKDRILKAVLYTSKYLKGVGNKKKVNPAGFVYFISFVSYLLRLVNPPNITLLDIASLVKDQISAKL